MNQSKWTGMALAGLLSVSSWAVFAGDGAPVDKGGMPPSTEMNAGPGPENALPPGSIGGGNGADANGSSTNPGAASEPMRGGNTMGSGSGSGAGGSGSSGGSGGGTGSAGGGTGSGGGGTGG